MKKNMRFTDKLGSTSKIKLMLQYDKFGKFDRRNEEIVFQNQMFCSEMIYEYLQKTDEITPYFSNFFEFYSRNYNGFNRLDQIYNFVKKFYGNLFIVESLFVKRTNNFSIKLANRLMIYLYIFHSILNIEKKYRHDFDLSLHMPILVSQEETYTGATFNYFYTCDDIFLVSDEYNQDQQKLIFIFVNYYIEKFSKLGVISSLDIDYYWASGLVESFLNSVGWKNADFFFKDQNTNNKVDNNPELWSKVGMYFYEFFDDIFKRKNFSNYNSIYSYQEQYEEIEAEIDEEDKEMYKYDLYSLLGIKNYQCSKDEIRAAFRYQAKIYHPDVSKEENAIEKFKLIKKACDFLCDDKKRTAYNRIKRIG